ncbi:MAG: hypothetical protein NC221_00655 [Duncaniella sp.]|nr:hypothetical protein [Muribaculum sp.]MCM1254618.1 hypothetical protein [Duncaniella sp.]
MLITLWGSDIKLDDHKGWDIVKNHALKTANDFGLEAVLVKSNFREFINYRELFSLVKNSGDEWWHGFQHGIGLIGHAAPLVWNRGLKKIYIASSFTKNDHVTCASDPSIDNYVRIAGCQTIHDQYEHSRQIKVDHICEYVDKTKTPLNLRVCWITSGGVNCCKCEKCLRTMFEIFGSGHDPLNYGFNYNLSHLKKSKTRVLDGYNFINEPLWAEIKERFNSSQSLKLPKEIEWIKTLDVNRAKNSPSYRFHRHIQFIRSLPLRVIHKIIHVLKS